MGPNTFFINFIPLLLHELLFFKKIPIEFRSECHIERRAVVVVNFS